jgi:hypothetical protein
MLTFINEMLSPLALFLSFNRLHHTNGMKAVFLGRVDAAFEQFCQLFGSDAFALEFTTSMHLNVGVTCVDSTLSNQSRKILTAFAITEFCLHGGDKQGKQQRLFYPSATIIEQSLLLWRRQMMRLTIEDFTSTRSAKLGKETEKAQPKTAHDRVRQKICPLFQKNFRSGVEDHPP